MKDIVKTFPGVRALDHVSFRVRQGEIHCLVGENGAGKSTLMKVLSGVYPHGAYEGEIVYKGREAVFRGIADSEKAGIAVIYQELAQFPELTVCENLFIGHEIMKGNGARIDWPASLRRAEELLLRVRLRVDPSVKIKRLGVGKRQLIEIAKALSKNVGLLVLDEPTAALNDDDSANLLNLLRELKLQGVTCVLISHKLREVLSLADTVTILRDGAVVRSLDARAGKLAQRDIIRHMVGRAIDDIYPKRNKSVPGEVCLSLKGWTVYDPATEREILHQVSLSVRRGEIVGLAGLMGAGRTELALSLFGNTPAYKITSGELEVKGKTARFTHPKQAIRMGLAYVTEDRKRNGLVLIQDIRFNITLAALRDLVKGLAVDRQAELRAANEYKEAVGIRAPSVRQLVGNLSGGNQQKTSLSKWLFARPDILILDEPTRGIDVGAKFEIYQLMNRLVEQGMSILMISSELLEILGMSDRVYVMAEGRIVGETPACDATEQIVMAMATNAQEASA
ncbi:MAG: sugar ABC transporter ATP-binding protein [Oscillospiraceae bacterium]|jgi:putative multiple sugar transport system ATP-binding protein|nr:sugar ABC transporter ATP-binding protein [Oscillospiraceae bacterium]